MKILRIILCALALATLSGVAQAQTTFVTPGGGRVNSSVVMCLNGSNQAVPCSSVTPLQTTGGGGGGGGAVTAAASSYSSAFITPITPIVSAAAEGSHVLKATAGTLLSVYATNLTTTAGFLVLINATSAPADGAITPLACVPLAPSGGQPASINYNPGPGAAYSTGIVAVLSSAATCFTKTTGVITGFIAGAIL